MSKSVARLIQQFKPENYNLSIEIDPEKMTFSGKAIISGQKTGRPSQRITFHQNKIKVTAAKVTKKDKKGETKIEVNRINHHGSLNEVRLHSPSMLYPGSYTVELNFEGKITKNMSGLYPCHFKQDGEDKKLFATQFESHHAREVFPCIDEPEAKATFDLSLTLPEKLAAISNMPEVSRTAENGSQTVVFDTTPIMSTYLLAFVAGEMHYVETKSKNGITIRSWASTAQDKAKLKYSAKEAADVLDFFEEYFKTPFPLAKCDQIALPDFESGAMENWGLITYREIALLTDPKNRSLPAEQYTSMVIAHELSHQWFGNLVTMKWWDDLWLNESFASLMEYIALDALHPEWHEWEQYAAQDMISCSNRDIYSDVQAVSVDVNHPDEIGTLFDPAIVYAKGGRLLKMVREYIGDEAFRSALQNYFKIHSYKNTVRADLWKEMSLASGKDVDSLMTPWLLQSGMPVLSLKEKSGNLEISQSRFLLDEKQDNSTWPVPLLASSKMEPDLLSDKTAAVKSHKKYPIINAEGSGHYVVHYDDPGYRQAIIDFARNPETSSISKMNILNDLQLLARRGDVSLVDSLRLVAQMKNEPRNAVWELMSRALGLAYTLGEEDENIERSLKNMRYGLAHEQYEELGWEDKETDDPNTKLLRSTIAGFMIGSENQEMIDFVLKYYKERGLYDIPSDRRGYTLSTKVRYDASKKDIDYFVNEYKTTADPDIQLSIAAALTHTKSEDTAAYLISQALSADGFVRDQDVFRWFAYLMRNKYTRNLAWQWLTSSWDRLVESFGGSKSLDYFVVYSSGPLHTREWQKKFLEFYEPKSEMIELRRNIAVAKSEIEARIKWAEREVPKLREYFKSPQ